MNGQILEFVKSAISALWGPIRAASRRARIWFFQLRNRKPPFDEQNVKQILYPLLAGDIPRAISYRNIDSPHIFIAAIRQSSARDHDPRVYVLEQIGQTFKVVWKCDSLSSADPALLEVQDIDADGHREVIFEDRSYGTGAGSRSLMIYSTRRQKLFRLTESLNWQNLAGPTSPEVELEPADDLAMVKILEEIAVKRAFLQPGTPIDFENPKFAVQRWHKENGASTNGEVKLHYYNDQPCYGSTPVIKCDTGPTLWMSFFKGPLFGFEKHENRHFIVYSPACFYNWAKCLAFDGKNLWFGVHCKAGLMCFRPRENFLRLYRSFRGDVIPEVEDLEIEDGTLVLNRAVRIPIHALLERYTN